MYKTAENKNNGRDGPENMKLKLILETYITLLYRF